MVGVVKAVRAPVSPAWLRAVVGAAATVPEIAARLPANEWEAVVKISGDRELRRLNQRFLAEDRVTDVLSFPTGEASPGSHVGDIVVSWPAVLRQGREFRHGSLNELGLLVVHGFLHLLGWDHRSGVEEREMNRLTREALARAGIRIAAARLLSPDQGG